MIKSMDQNGDGKLSADEMPDPMRERMSAADTNGDGFYDVAELTAAFANMGGGAGGDRPGAGGPEGGGPEGGGPGGRGPGGGPPGGGP